MSYMTNIHEHIEQPQQSKAVNEEKQIDRGERQLLVRSAICLSVLGVIAFLITGQLGVVVAMNAPLLAIIGKVYFFR